MRDDIPKRYRNLANKAKKGSRAAAIRLFCLECVGYSTADVRGCTAPECPLYPYRTGKYQEGEDENP